jgi:organic radical activating enzyme
MSNKGDEVKSKDGALRSNFMVSAEQAREQLGPALCLAKWQQVSLHLTNGWNNSCYHPALQPIPQGEIAIDVSALHNTSWKKEQRKRMLDGIKPPECSYCWHIEDTGNLSDRHYRSAEPWAAEHYDAIVSQPWDQSVTPSYVEVNFNYGCNLKCSYCSPQFSSTWMKDIEDNGAYPTTVPHNALEHFTGSRRPIPNREYNPYVEAFWKWWPTLYTELKHFRMTGGEPLMDKNTYKVFDYVLANPKEDLHLNVTSNFSVEDVLFEKYMTYIHKICEPQANNVEHFMQYVSLDSVGKQAEYIRTGMDFNRVWTNVNRYLEEVPYKNSLTFIITMNNLSLPGITTFLKEILALRKKYSMSYQRVWFDTPLLRSPVWQSIQIMPPAYQMYLEEALDFMKANMETEATRFHGFKDYEVQRIERDLAYMKTGTENIGAAVDFYKYFNESDKRNNTSFTETFPEMKDWWEYCKYQSQQGNK